MEKYRKVKIVGQGSFGCAVLVQSKKSRKQYIMKIIDLSKMDQKQIEEALMQVHLLKVMRYPYIVTYRQSFMEKMCLCIVMDYCEGGDIFHRIANQKQLNVLFSEQQIMTWFVQMTLAMNYVHDKKILHRDLKTQNIFLTSRGDIKIGDFGIARVLQHTYDCANTAIGTPYYLSPQICQQKPYNQKSDVWSLGCIFYEIATLNHAFDAQNMKGLVQKILKGTYPPLPEIYSCDLKKLLSEMLIKDPAKRPSIKKILEMPFMKSKIHQLFSSTVKIHQLNLGKERSMNSYNTSTAKSQQARLQQSKPEDKSKKSSKQKVITIFKKKQQLSKEKKIQVVSKNYSGLNFKKKGEAEPLRQIKLNHKRGTAKDENRYSSRSNHNEQLSAQKFIKKDKENQEKSVFQEQQTLEEQGYGILIRDMKQCIKGGHTEEETAWKQQERLVPKYLNLQKVPGVGNKDSVGSKIEALRAYLQKQIGDKFYSVYNLIKQQKDEDYEIVKSILGKQCIKFIPLVVQLIVCEDNYY